jgi:phosphoribosylglycinamide formyltransferase-1
MSARHRLGILLSGRGSNFVALADAIDSGLIPDAAIAVVLSNRPDAPGLQLARERGFPTHAVPAGGRTREAQDAEFLAYLRDAGVTLVCLAGYMRLLSPVFIAAFPSAILNIHPSLLPAFPGLNAQSEALAYGVAVTGCTAHFVDEQLDHGVIVGQTAVPVEPGDDEASLSARILTQEHLLYPQAVARVIAGTFRTHGRRFFPLPSHKRES